MKPGPNGRGEARDGGPGGGPEGRGNGEPGPGGGADERLEAEREAILELLDAARAFAVEAGEITLRYFGGVVPAEAKGDGSPVTRADREAEETLRRRILDRFPDHGILGEEFGETRPGARVRWILDPIDGTRSFMRGVPLYGVLIGVELAGSPVVGVAHFPALAETVSAGTGLGCHWNGNPIVVSEVGELDRSLLLTTDPAAARRSLVTPGWHGLEDRCNLSRSWGDCYGHILVATGRAEIMVDPELSPWDAAPLLTILEEAGGRFTSVAGDRSIHGGSGVSTNGRLHDQVLSLLAEGPDD